MTSLATDMRKFAIVAISRDEAIIWKEGLDSVHSPTRVKPPVEVGHRHMRTGQFQHGHDTVHRFPEYFEEVASHLKEAEGILLMGHGKGKGNYAHHLLDHLNEKHRDISAKVVDQINVNLPALSVHELEAYARGWFEKNYRKLGSWHSRKRDRRFSNLID